MKRITTFSHLPLILCAFSLILGCGSPPPPETATSGGPGRPPFSLAVPHKGIGYGMNAQLLFNGGLELDLRMIQSLGFNWVLQQFPWEVLEKQKGAFDWAQTDAIVDTADRFQVNVVARLDRPPAWAAPRPAGVNSSPPTNLEDYGNFAAAVASRYRGRIQAYQIWDEPNLWTEWGGKGKVKAEEYVALLKVAYERIKAVDPKAVIIGANLSPTDTQDAASAIDDLTYLQQFYAAGGAKYCDVIGAHGAGYNHAPDAAIGSDSAHPQPSFYFRRIEQLREVMEKNGDKGKQIWLTEFGWTSDNVNKDYMWFAVDEKTKGAYLVKAFEMGKAYPWMGVMFLWNFNFVAMSPPNDEKGFWSIINRDHTGRDAFTLLQAMPK